MSDINTIAATPAVNNPALTRLIDVQNNIAVNDMNYIFHYTRVIKPDNVASNLFALHYKENQQTNWSSCKSLLTDQFTVAKTDLIIGQIQDNLGGNIQGERHYRSDTSVKSSFTLSGYQIDIGEEPDIDLVLFKLMTNLDAEIRVLTSSKLTFNIINGFSGNHALSLNFGLMKTMTTDTNDGRIVPVNNVFILDKFTKRIVHDNRLSINIEDVTNVQRNIVEQITNFKRVEFTPALVETMNSVFPKKFMKKFSGMYDNLPENLRNYYYVTYILSSLLDDEKKIALEIKLRAFISERVNRAIDAFNAAPIIA
jgi:hypothetical protein